MVGPNQGGSFSLSFIAGSSDAGFGVTSTICRSTRSITRRMVSKGIPLSGSVTATFVGMSSPRSLASRASILMSASAFDAAGVAGKSLAMVSDAHRQK
jgi:hypothetical protein